MVSPGSPRRGRAGQSTSEYLIILVGIAVVCLAIAVLFGGKVKALFGLADEEVATWGEGSGGLDEGLGGGSGDGSGGGDGSAGDDWGDEGGGDGGGGDDGGAAGGPRGRSGGGASGRGGGGGGGGDGDDWLVTADRKPKRGVTVLGEGEDAVTVVAADPDGYKSPAEQRELERQQQASQRAEDVDQWERKQRRVGHVEAEGEWSEPKRSGMDLTRVFLVVLLLVAGLVVARTMLGGKEGKG